MGGRSVEIELVIGWEYGIAVTQWTAALLINTLLLFHFLFHLVYSWIFELFIECVFENAVSYFFVVLLDILLK